MSDRSAIEWTDASWNPIRAGLFEIQDDGSGKERIGWHCEHISEGCRNCYAERINLRLGTGFEFKPGNLRGRPGYHGGGIDHPKLFLDEAMLTLPLRWKKPRKIFVCSMTDLFADFVPYEWIDKMFAVMALCPQHMFQVLTKRAARMRYYFADANLFARIDAKIREQWDSAINTQAFLIPLPNVWFGVSCERQEEADERIPLLLETPAAVRFVSAEPLLGPIDLREIHIDDDDEDITHIDALTGDEGLILRRIGGTRLDWVIAGGESGPNARPMHPDWARSLRDQCEAARVPFFFKQWGGWIPHTPRAAGDLGGEVRSGRVKIVHPTGQSDVEVYAATGGRSTIPGSRYMARVGKKSAGRLLDGKEHNEFPVRAGRAEAA